ncbi:MAG: gluconate 2-dehydrogenase subunit 3 family protein [Gemmatimonadota bacterium]
MTSSRRSFLSTAAGVGAVWLISDWSSVREALAHAAVAAQQRPAPPFSTLSVVEAAELGAMAERIMPTTETPGAREAGVIYFMDRALGSFQKEALPDVRKGVADLKVRAVRRKAGSSGLAGLPPADQDALLTEIEKTEFFEGVRYLTMVGMFAKPSYGGNRGEVGWKLLGFEHRPAYTPPFGYYDAEAAKGR